MGPVERAIRDHVVAGAQLRTPSRDAPFTVSKIDERGVELLLGQKEALTRLSWDCLEGIPEYLAGRNWVRIGSLYDVGAEPGTLDAYLKQHIKRATAGWVAALLEEAGVVNIDASRPASVHLNAAFRRERQAPDAERHAVLVPAPPRQDEPALIVPAPRAKTPQSVDVAVRFRWQQAREIHLDRQRLLFPHMPAAPGLYRMSLSGDPERVYIGESTDLRRRMANYRNPGPTQQTNVRLNAVLIDHLQRGHVGVSVATRAQVLLHGHWHNADLADKHLRRLAENAALVAELPETLQNL